MIRRLPVAAALLLACGSCRSTAAPEAGEPSRFGAGVSELEVHALVRQMADDYDAKLAEATYTVLRESGSDPKGRWLALSFLRNGMGAALDIAVGPNPDVALLDLLVLASLQAWAFEEHWIPAGIDPEGGRAAAERLREAEAAMWGSARRVLSEDHERTLRELVATWITEHPDQMVVSLVRFEDFTEEREMSTLVSRGRASVLLREVEEATSAVEEARLFGERALWFAGRYPYVLGQQMELTAYRMVDQPEVREALEAVGSLARLGEALAPRIQGFEASVADLFARVREERAAAVEDVFSRVDEQREELLAELDTVRSELGTTLETARAAADAATEAGRSMAGAAEALDRLAARFDREATAGSHEPPRLADLRVTALEANEAAERLEALFTRLEASAASGDWGAGLDAAEGAAADLLDAAFTRAALLVVLLVGGLAVVRRIPRRQP